MSVWPLLLVAVVLAVDAGFGLTVDGFRDRPLPIALFAVIPTAIIVSLTWWRCVRVARQVRAGRLEALPHTAALVKAAQVLVILNAVVLVLMMDWLFIVRTVLGNGILLDELAASNHDVIAGLGFDNGTRFFEADCTTTRRTFSGRVADFKSLFTL